MSAHGQVVGDLHELRCKLLTAGMSDNKVLVRKMLDLVGCALADGHEPTYEELLQGAALLTVAAEAVLVGRTPPTPNSQQ